MNFDAVYSTVGVTPISTTEVKQHTRIDTAADDGLLVGYIEAAIDVVERTTLYKMKPQTAVLTFNEFPNVLPIAPVQAITTIAYTGTNDAAAVFTDYTIQRSLSRTLLVPNNNWPAMANKTQVTITCQVGPTTLNDVPEGLRNWVYRCVAMMYNDRGFAPEAMADQLYPYVITSV
ncbi:MAG: head-tail connector protein [Pseudomonadota bacterium]